MATAGNDFLTVLRYGQTLTLDGLGGTDTLNFDRLSQSSFTITQGADGYIHVDSVSGASSTFHFKLVNVEKLLFRSGRDSVDLTTLFPAGTDGNDTLNGTAGNDTLNGKAGIDTLVHAGSRAHCTLSSSGSSYTVTDTTGAAGIDTLTSIERISFADGMLALDLDGNAGKVVKALGAVFGAASVHNQQYVGIGLSLLDGGMGYEALCQLAVEATGKTSNADIVQLLWNNVVGSPISTSNKAEFVGLLQNGMTVGALAMMAADTALNTANIGLVGLQQTGIEYLPAG